LAWHIAKASHKAVKKFQNAEFSQYQYPERTIVGHHQELKKKKSDINRT